MSISEDIFYEVNLYIYNVHIGFEILVLETITSLYMRIYIQNINANRGFKLRNCFRLDFMFYSKVTTLLLS